MSGLCTDLYELRMAASYLKRGMAGSATFSLFVRKLPPQRGFLVAAGLGDALTFLDAFGFDNAEIDYLRNVVGLDTASLTALRGTRFTGEVWAIPEGRVVFAGESFLEVTAPIAEAQLVETAVLNLITFQTTIASKAARCWIAARGAELVDFAFRRTHGLDAAMGVARASAIAGFTGTSNVEAARRFRLRPATGDILGLRNEPVPPHHVSLLEPVMRGGRRVHDTPPARKVAATRDRFTNDLAWLPDPARWITDPIVVPVRRSEQLVALREHVANQLARGGASSEGSSTKEK